ncbi:MAG: SMI1/KNR4 family protein [Prevotella sp.]|jgi:hypothetical protein|nr:SMI1/KNR4 family protein [Prevotella sp.]
MSETENKISIIEKEVGIHFPESYKRFLGQIPEGEIYEVENTGIVFYSWSDLRERNTTYEIKEYDPDSL